MDVLTVFANSDSVFDNHAVVRVYWCTGLHRKKAIDVRDQPKNRGIQGCHQENGKAIHPENRPLRVWLSDSHALRRSGNSGFKGQILVPAG